MTTLELQQALSAAGFDPGPHDGIYGPDTRGAVLAFQRSRGLVVDGVVGPETRRALTGPTPPPADFTGPALRLADVDIGRIAARIGVGEDELHAVIHVETAGGGFDAQDRPKMLFEPHIFWKQLGDSPARERAFGEGLAYPRWGQRPYPPDSYPRLQAAMRIDAETALRSASWGLGQIMGFNAAMCGYASAADMVEAFKASEAAQLEAMVRFIDARELDDELRRHDWAGFARGYNGAAFATHGYHTRLAERFAFWRRKPDTPIGEVQP